MNKLTLRMPYQLFIGGMFVDAEGAKTYETINPTDGSVSASLSPPLPSLLPTYPMAFSPIYSPHPGIWGFWPTGARAWMQKGCSHFPVLPTGMAQKGEMAGSQEDSKSLEHASENGTELNQPPMPQRGNEAIPSSTLQQ